MNLVIVHYHLKRGGVTSVIANHVKALDHARSEFKRILILYGADDSGWPEDLESDLKHVTLQRQSLESLAYEAPSDAVHQRLADEIVAVIRSAGFESGETVAQVHNHNLGKNISLTAAIHQLADQGISLLLHIHDFAEDYRPDNFVRLKTAAKRLGTSYEELVFPRHRRIHYGCLNYRDHEALVSARIPENQIHFLPNPVQHSGSTRSPSAAGRRDADAQALRSELGLTEQQRLVIYPVRAIRRKNIGEAMLFAVANPDVHVAITLPATSREELPAYEDFAEFSVANQLPVSLEIGASNIPFRSVIAAADYLLTTSITEGFGLVFLESWLMGKQLIGRDLEEITVDFKQAGLNLSAFYDRVMIPTEWFDRSREVEEFRRSLSKVLKSYGLEGKEIEQMCQSAEVNRHTTPTGSMIDFAALSSNTQRKIILDVHRDPAKGCELLESNPAFRCPDGVDEKLVHQNAATAAEHFSLEQFSTRFVKTLRQSHDTASEESLNEKSESTGSRSLVKHFLTADRFFPIRVEC